MPTGREPRRIPAIDGHLEPRRHRVREPDAAGFVAVVRGPCGGRGRGLAKIVREHRVARRQCEIPGRRVIERERDVNAGVQLGSGPTGCGIP